MPLYYYTALSKNGALVPGEIAAASEQEVRQELTGEGLLAQNVRKRRGGGLRLFQRRPVRPENFLLFNQEFLALVRARRTGEKSGDLVNVLARYQDYLRHRVALHKKVSQALAYPAFLLLALGVIMAVLFVFVMPRFVAMYSGFDAALPWPTRGLIGVGGELP